MLSRSTVTSAACNSGCIAGILIPGANALNRTQVKLGKGVPMRLSCHRETTRIFNLTSRRPTASYSLAKRWEYKVRIRNESRAAKIEMIEYLQQAIQWKPAEIGRVALSEVEECRALVANDTQGHAPRAYDAALGAEDTHADETAETISVPIVSRSVATIGTPHGSLYGIY